MKRIPSSLQKEEVFHSSDIFGVAAVNSSAASISCSQPLDKAELLHPVRLAASL